MVSNITMKKTEKKSEKTPLTPEEVQDIMEEARLAAEIIRTRGMNARIYGCPETRRRNRR